jgi:uncharacterized protein YndB with AHSA1/START domain
MSETDRIEKTIHLKAPRAKVWSALTDSAQFGAWFGVKMDGPFRANTAVRGQLTIKGYEHVTGDWHITAIEPQTRFAYTWHPYAVDPSYDYSKDAMTLVEFTLADDTGGTRLTVVESGFDRLPIGRRAEALSKNTGGWTGQLQNIERYVAGQ